MTCGIPLTKKRNLTLISAYAPTLVTDEATKDAFYTAFDATLQNISISDKVGLICDFNAGVGRNWELWSGCPRPSRQGQHEQQQPQTPFILCRAWPCYTNTIFHQKDKFKNSWKHPRSSHWHMLDYIITRQCHTNDVTLTRAMRWAEWRTDHRLVRAQFEFQILPLIHKQATRKKIYCGVLKDPGVRDSFRAIIATCLSSHTIQATDPDEEWHKLCFIMLKSAEATIGLERSSNADWSD